jgi:hypothetical protein
MPGAALHTATLDAIQSVAIGHTTPQPEIGSALAYIDETTGVKSSPRPAIQKSKQYQFLKSIKNRSINRRNRSKTVLLQ